MSDFLGPLRRDGDALVTEVKPHPFVLPKARRDAAGQRAVDPFCTTCGYHRTANVEGTLTRPALWVHPDERP